MLQARSGVSGLQNPEAGLLVERWFEESGSKFDFKRYPAAKYLLGKFILQSELMSQGLFREVTALGQKIAEEGAARR